MSWSRDVSGDGLARPVEVVSLATACLVTCHGLPRSASVEMVSLVTCHVSVQYGEAEGRVMYANVLPCLPPLLSYTRLCDALTRDSPPRDAPPALRPFPGGQPRSESRSV